MVMGGEVWLIADEGSGWDGMLRYLRRGRWIVERADFVGWKEDTGR